MTIKANIAKHFGLLLSVLALTFAFAVAASPERAHAAETKDTKTTDTKKAADTADETYTYVAQPGDSYTQMARKAIQTYGIVNKVNLSGAQIIFAETNLTIAAGSPVLNQGQTVTIKQADVKNIVGEAQKLTDEQKNAWAYYVPFVDFNTDAVGQAK